MQGTIEIENVERDAQETSDPRIPRRRSVVSRYVMEHWYRDRPGKVFVKFGDNGEEWTYGELRDRVVRTAVGLQQLGVEQGAHVLVWLPNCRENLLCFFAINYLGAVFVPINTAYKGALLAHVIRNSDARLAIVHSELLDIWERADLAQLEKVVVVGQRKACSRLDSHHYADVLTPASGKLLAPGRPIEPWDPQSIIYTSGTTGPSKGVLSSYLHVFSNCGPETWSMITEDDRFMINVPMFHIGGMGVTYSMFVRGGSVALLERFDTAAFWRQARETGTTATFLLGSMAGFLQKQPDQPEQQGQSLRTVFIVPFSASACTFSSRFGCDVYTIFNMTEISTPILSDKNPALAGTCGRKRPGVDVRLVDDHDCEVRVGEIGEMLVRTDRPWAMNSGYYKNPEATAEAWRNGWFHTGDLFRKDAEGNFFFVDRKKDAIRRRGENISSHEVEAEALAHPGVQEAAAIGVPNELSEEDVLLVIVPVPGLTLDPREILDFLLPRLAHFMIPRYIRFLSELPKTHSTKVKKHELCNEGVTADTWDREAAGIQIKMKRFS